MKPVIFLGSKKDYCDTKTLNEATNYAYVTALSNGKESIF